MPRKKGQPGCQVICLWAMAASRCCSAMMTTLQEDIPIKIAVYDNGKLGFVEIEQRAEGMLNLYTDLKNPDFGKVAQALGLWSRTVDTADELEMIKENLL
jgi:pyruvate dehydrogenase (quinone)